MYKQTGIYNLNRIFKQNLVSWLAFQSGKTPLEKMNLERNFDVESYYINQQTLSQSIVLGINQYPSYKIAANNACVAKSEKFRFYAGNQDLPFTYNFWLKTPDADSSVSNFDVPIIVKNSNETNASVGTDVNPSTHQYICYLSNTFSETTVPSPLNPNIDVTMTSQKLSIVFKLRMIGSTDNFNNHYTKTTDLNYNSLYQISLVYDPTKNNDQKIKLYINLKDEAIFSSIGISNLMLREVGNNSQLVLGAALVNGNYSSSNRNILISELSVFDKALNISELKTICQATLSEKYFNASSGIISGSPRLELHNRDHVTGSYPSKAFHGQPGHNGRYPVVFDDRSTIVFGQDEEVQFPTMLPSDSKWVDGNTQRPHELPSIVALGSIVRGISDSHVRFTSGQETPPFDDSRNDFASSSPFYAEGTSEGQLPGFSARLTSKESFTIDINPVEVHDVYFSTGSTVALVESHPGISYFNFKEKKWQKLKQTEENQFTFSGLVFKSKKNEVNIRITVRKSYILNKIQVNGDGSFIQIIFQNNKWTYQEFIDAIRAVSNVDDEIEVFLENEESANNKIDIALPSNQILENNFTLKSIYSPTPEFDYINSDISVATGSYLAFTPSPYWGLSNNSSNRNMLASSSGGGSFEAREAALASVGKPTSFAGFPLASKFDANDDQVISLKDYINGPFVLEKIVFEVSGVLGAYPAFSGSSSGLPSLEASRYNLGHGTQFFAMVQNSNRITSSITGFINYASGSTPASAKIYNQETYFDQNRLKNIVFSANVGSHPISIYVNSSSFLDTKLGSIYDKSYAVHLDTNGGIGSNGSPLYFRTGSINFEKKISNPGISEKSTFSAYTRGPSNSIVNNFCYFYGEELGGADLFNISNSRAYSRKTQTSNYVGSVEIDPVTKLRANVFDQDKEPTPMILMPEDNLVIGVANQPIPSLRIIGYQDSNPIYDDDEIRNEHKCATYYKTTLLPGIGKITFYGTYVSDGKPLPSDSAQQLTSDALHSSVESKQGNISSNCADNFYVDSELMYAGGYLDMQRINVEDGPISFVNIAAGFDHALGLTFDGKVYSWGNNDQGQLGLNQSPDYIARKPVRLQAFKNIKVKKIEAGNKCSFAIDDDGNLWSWGSNLNFQLGLGILSQTFFVNKPQKLLNYYRQAPISLGNPELIRRKISNVKVKNIKVSNEGTCIALLEKNDSLTSLDFDLSNEPRTKLNYTNIIAWGKCNYLDLFDETFNDLTAIKEFTPYPTLVFFRKLIAKSSLDLEEDFFDIDENYYYLKNNLKAWLEFGPTIMDRSVNNFNFSYSSSVDSSNFFDNATLGPGNLGITKNYKGFLSKKNQAPSNRAECAQEIIDYGNVDSFLMSFLIKIENSISTSSIFSGQYESNLNPNPPSPDLRYNLQISPTNNLYLEISGYVNTNGTVQKVTYELGDKNNANGLNVLPVNEWCFVSVYLQSKGGGVFELIIRINNNRYTTNSEFSGTGDNAVENSLNLTYILFQSNRNISIAEFAIWDLNVAGTLVEESMKALYNAFKGDIGTFKEYFRTADEKETPILKADLPERYDFDKIALGTNHGLIATKWSDAYDEEGTPPRDSNRVFSFGKNDKGQLGKGDINAINTLTTNNKFYEITRNLLDDPTLQSAEGVNQLEASGNSSWAVIEGWSSTLGGDSLNRIKSIKSWGENTYGQLGNGSTTDRDSPVEVLQQGIDNYEQDARLSKIKAGNGQVIAIRSYRTSVKDGNESYDLASTNNDAEKKDVIYTWGRNTDSALLGVPSNTESNVLTPIKAKEFVNWERSTDVMPFALGGTIVNEGQQSYAIRFNESQYYAWGKGLMGIEDDQNPGVLNGISRVFLPTVSRLKKSAGRQEIIESSLQSSSNKKSVQKFSRLKRSDVTYYDSHVPVLRRMLSPENIASNNLNIVFEDKIVNELPLGIGEVQINLAVFSDPTSDIPWTHVFPFAPEFSGIPRADTLESINFKEASAPPTNGVEQETNISDFSLVDSIVVYGSSIYDPSRDEVYLETLRYGGPNPDYPYLSPFSYLVRPEFISKAFYCFGDYRKFPLNFKRLKQPYSIPKHFLNAEDWYVESKSLYIDEFFDPEEVILPRGYKYGLINAVPQNPSCVFRHDRYGQMRDMLEQGVDTFFKHVEKSIERTTNLPPISIRFINRTDGSTAVPSSTQSHNLSLHATSSLPYFDRDYRDRTY